jgi:hypothetical protein
LQECSAATWTVGTSTCPAFNIAQIDYWKQPFQYPWVNSSGVKISDSTTGSLNTYVNPSLTSPPPIPPRAPEDVILTDVIGFDVKVLDPGVGDYVDLGYNPSLTGTYATPFSGIGNTQSGIDPSVTPYSRVYDTWSQTYENFNGFDNNSAASGTPIVDASGNGVSGYSYPPPYPVPLRGIKVTIRVFEPASRQIREVSVVQDFLNH